jgi:hypothetical protein
LDNICFPFYCYTFSVGLWKCFHSVVFLCFFPIFIITLRSVLENTMWYNGILGQRIDVGILDVVTVISADDCARRCHQHINCNNFNFRRINMTFLDFSNWSDIGVFLCFPFHFYDFSVKCWNCPNSVVFVFHFIIILRLCFRKYDVVR